MVSPTWMQQRRELEPAEQCETRKVFVAGATGSCPVGSLTDGPGESQTLVCELQCYIGAN